MFTKCQVFITFLFVAIFATFAIAQDDVVVDDVVGNDVVNNNVDIAAADSAMIAADAIVDVEAELSAEAASEPATQTRRAIDLDRLLGDDEYTDIFEEEPEVDPLQEAIDTAIQQALEDNNIATRGER